MPLATWALYYKATNEVFNAVEVDDTEVIDDAALLDMGYVVADVGARKLPADLAETAEDTDSSVSTVTINTTTGATTAATANLSLAERQARMLALLTSLAQSYDWTQALDSLLTSASRAEFKLWRDKLGSIPRSGTTYYQSTWATNPEGIVIPDPPTPSYATTDLAERLPEFMADNSLGIRKTFLKDRGNLLPEFGFDEGDLTYFNLNSTTNEGFTSSSRSGGLALKFYKALSGTDGIIAGKREFSSSVRANFLYYWRVDFRLDSIAGGTTIAGGFQLRIRYYDELGGYIGEGSGALGTWDATDSYQVMSGITQAPGNAKYATFAMVIPAGVNINGGIRVDNVKMWEVIDSAMIESLDAAKLTGTIDVVARIAAKSLPLTKLVSANANRWDVLSWSPETDQYESRQHIITTLDFQLSNPTLGAVNQMGTIYFGGPATSNLQNRDWRTPYSGRIIGGFLNSSSARTAGTATLRARISGTDTSILGNSIQINGTDTTSSSALIRPGEAGAISFGSGVALGAALDVTSSFLPTGNDYAAALILQYDPR